MFVGAEFSIDRGGTFTDIFAQLYFDDGRIEERVMKLLSTSSKYADAPAEGIRRILSNLCEISSSEKIPLKLIKSVKLGSTIATNALLERKGTPFGLVVTEGFKDILLIGNQQRPNIFSLHIVKERPIYSRVIEVDERILIKGDNSTIVEKEIDPESVRQKLQRIYDEGLRNLAISFCHSILQPTNEQKVECIAREIGFKTIICSHTVGVIPNYLNRTGAACIETYLTPIVHQYFDSFKQNFEDNLSGVPCFVMLSDGSLFPMGHGLSACRMIMSGPAGGVKGASNMIQSPTLSFDMGGTSTDVSRLIPNLDPEIIQECKIGGHSITIPQLAILTVAAGGGSILRVEDNMLKVGPDSAGAVPGPMIYGIGGSQLTITDANYLLGRIYKSSFALMFESRDVEALQGKFKEICISCKSIEQMASDFIDVANESMCKPIRNLTEARGMPAKGHVLNCFGGAGGQHCCAMANILGIDQIFIHRNSSILSAIGISQSPVEVSKSRIIDSDKVDLSLLNDITKNAREEMESYNLTPSGEHYRLYMKYQDSDLILVIKQSKLDVSEAIRSFISDYKKRFGFELSGRKVIIQSVETIVQHSFSNDNTTEPIKKRLALNRTEMEYQNVWFGGDWIKTPVIQMYSMFEVIEGPCLVVNENTTIWIEPGWKVEPSSGHLKISRRDGAAATTDIPLEDATWLSRFSLRFMSIAEQMGTALLQSSISTNIKERLDFSCAVFDSDGFLIANAPHIPVHLGAMQNAIQFQIKFFNGQLFPGMFQVKNFRRCLD